MFCLAEELLGRIGVAEADHGLHQCVFGRNGRRVIKDLSLQCRPVTSLVHSRFGRLVGVRQLGLETMSSSCHICVIGLRTAMVVVCARWC